MELKSRTPGIVHILFKNGPDPRPSCTTSAAGFGACIKTPQPPPSSLACGCIEAAATSQQRLQQCTYAQVEFPAGKTIFRKGDPGEEFYLVRKGSAIVIDDSGKCTYHFTRCLIQPDMCTLILEKPRALKVLTRLTPGQYFGELALLGGK
eukprot:scaffold44036_cov19-Tisochrysis_lutea.AAC.2